MIKKKNNQDAFLALVRAGLWEKDVRLSEYQSLDFNVVYQLAEQQSVVGLVAAGLEHVVDVVIPSDIALLFAETALQIEQRNRAMNFFIARLFNRIQKDGINALLIKGQGVAQYYNRPLWRAAGDVDLLLSVDNYRKAYNNLSPIAQKIETEQLYNLHQSIYIDNWEVELHGTLRGGVWKSLDNTIDLVLDKAFCEGYFQEWQIDNTIVRVPSIDNAVFIVFTHILQHLYKGGIGLRQICDLCRLVYTSNEKIDKNLLETRLLKMGAMSEWQIIGSFALTLLDFPENDYPLFAKKLYGKKLRISRLFSFIIETGNFGHNRDNSYYKRYPYLCRKIISFWKHTNDIIKYFTISPKGALKVWNNMIMVGTKAVLKWE